ncbi:uncharacterized protein LOC143289868 isoform X3 [Babylonia areolata]|uniref:uncharacterized protein LOC143289868 isoform X3 n=1 Tax=Babylonia areolata TaxID=304850 RepID=UPI003FD2A0CB
MMDINKILDFHRMVMLAASQQASEDETSCGPLCQHPACWHSKRRQERGVSRVKSKESEKEEEEESRLPTMSYYNMLDDYGESPKDRYPARFGGRAPHERSSSMRNISQPLRSAASFGMTPAPYATPVSPDKASRSSVQPGLRVVEVQEVFDASDLNSRWDETFITKQFLVWVPNPNRSSSKKPLLAITDREEGSKAVPKTLKPKDMTETMVPVHIQHLREDTVLADWSDAPFEVDKKRQDRSRSPIFSKGTYPKTPFSGLKPDVDTEGCVVHEIRERIQSSDFVSREKIHGIIQEVLDTIQDTGRDLSPPRTGTLHTGDVLLQQKAPLHHHKRQRHLREWPTLPTAPVFQLDGEDKASTVDTARLTHDADSTKDRYLPLPPGGSSRTEFAKDKKPLPSISGDEVGSSAEGRRIGGAAKERRKIPSISLGLPELPSGLRHTRAFVYNSKHRPDFSLVPVPTPPESSRSVGSLASDHGTTMRVNIPSVSDRPEAEYTYTGKPAVAEDRVTQEQGEEEDDRALHGVSPTLSTHVPKAPAGTPATFHSPSRLFRDLTAASSAGMQAGGDPAHHHPHGVPPSREVTMSPGHKICVPGATFAEQAPSSPDESALSTIKETGREQVGPSPSQSAQQQQQQKHSAGRVPSSEAAAVRPQGEGGRAEVTSPEDWPQVTEPTLDMVPGIMGSRSDTIFLTEHGPSSASSLHRGRPDLNSRGSERISNNSSNSLARRILDEGGKGESPAPPPPSPEPKEFGGDKSAGGGTPPNPHHHHQQRGGKAENRSRESNAMEPLLEQSESEGSTSPEKRSQAGGDKGRQEKGRPSTQGQSVEPVIQEEVVVVVGGGPPSPSSSLSPGHHHPSADPHLDPVSKVTVCHVAPRPSASREKLQQTFLNVDIPAEDMSSLHAEQGSSPLDDITPTPSASPAKLSTPKSSAGPGSPTRKSAGSGPRKGKGARKSGGQGKGRRFSGDGRAAGESEQPV